MNLSATSEDRTSLLPVEAIAAGYSIIVRRDLSTDLPVAQLVLNRDGTVVGWTGGGACVAGYNAGLLPWWERARDALYEAIDHQTGVLREIADDEVPLPGFEAPIGVAGWVPRVVGSAA